MAGRVRKVLSLAFVAIVRPAAGVVVSCAPALEAATR